MPLSGINDLSVNAEAVNDPQTYQRLYIMELIDAARDFALAVQPANPGEGLVATADFVVPDGRSVVLGVRRKQPVEVLTYVIAYSDWLHDRDGEVVDLVVTNVATVSSSAALAPDLTVSASVSAEDGGQAAHLTVENGTTGVSYKVEITATTSSGRVRQDELYLQVYER